MARDDERYNGWTNYETWCVKLWIDNEQATQETILDAARRWAKHREGIGSSREALFADEIEAWISDENAPTLTTFEGEWHALSPDGLYADLLRHALGSVDWYEIASAYLQDVADEWIPA